MTTTFTEGAHRAEFIRSVQDQGAISYENVTLILGQNLKAGTVVSKITASGKFTQLDTAAATGAQTAAGVLLGDVDASAGDTAAVIVARIAELNDALLVYPAGISGPNKTLAKANLATSMLIVR